MKRYRVGASDYRANRLCYIASLEVPGISRSVNLEPVASDVARHFRTRLETFQVPVGDISLIAYRLPRPAAPSVANFDPDVLPVEICGRIAFQTPALAQEAAKILKKDASEGTPYRFRCNAGFANGMIEFVQAPLLSAVLPTIWKSVGEDRVSDISKYLHCHQISAYPLYVGLWCDQQVGSSFFLCHGSDLKPFISVLSSLILILIRMCSFWSGHRVCLETLSSRPLTMHV